MKAVKIIWYTVCRIVCLIFCKALFRFRAYGVENVPKKGAFLLVSNHQSFLDPVFCGIALRRRLHFLARDTLFRNRFFGILIRSVNAIAVRRGEADLKAMRRIIEKLGEGGGVVLYPEATRSGDGRVGDFKPGFGLLCRRGEAGVMPMVVEGAFECWPRQKKMFGIFKKVVVSYGKYIPAEEVKKLGDRELAQRVCETIKEMQNECRVRMGKEPLKY